MQLISFQEDLENNLKKHHNSRNEEEREIILREMGESHSYLQNVNEVGIIKVIYHKKIFGIEF